MAVFQNNMTDEEKLAIWGPLGYSAEAGDVRYARLFQPRIVIIGAGASGLAAAQHLMDNDFTNIVILEAQSRVGGRVWSERIGKLF
jgi:NADPH-dependent 2,4-dienoyl-CoA reductase/sulfur reductase-like enzyme